MKHGRCCERATAAGLRSGQTAVVQELGRGRGFRARMIGMGLGPGAEMRIISRHGHGPCVVEVNRRRMMLGCEMLQDIILKGD